MPCFTPLKGWRSAVVGSSGKRPIVFRRSLALVDLPVTLPCGQCVGCRLEHSRQWAIRCVHEASLYDNNCFITLTFDDKKHKPPDNSLNVEYFQLFMKRLRKKYGAGIRYYHCGEYGENFGRPHYHACLFNFDFADKKKWMETKNKDILYRSAALERLWPFGFSSVGDVTFSSAAYVARYIMKKITGNAADSHYMDPVTGVYRTPEYTTMSRRPGIASAWLEQFQGDIYPTDFVVLNGKKMRPPKFYDTQFELGNAAEMALIKLKRKMSLRAHVDNNTPERLKTRETIQNLKLQLLRREFQPNE